jgi:hypothetical protein
MGNQMNQEIDLGYPQTIDEAIERLLDELNPEDIERIRQMIQSELISLHFNLGMYIRNNFGLWKGSSPLAKGHTDSTSMSIIKAFWQRLQDEKEPPAWW